MFTSSLDTSVHPLLGPSTADQRTLSRRAAERSALLQAVAERRRSPRAPSPVRRLLRRRTAEQPTPA